MLYVNFEQARVDRCGSPLLVYLYCFSYRESLILTYLLFLTCSAAAFSLPLMCTYVWTFALVG